MWKILYKHSVWTLKADGSIASSIKKVGPPYVFVHYCENEPTYDFREGTYWTEFETDSPEAASLGTGIFVEECKWRAVISLSEEEVGVMMEHGSVRMNGHLPVREYKSKIVIPNSMCIVTQLMLPDMK